MQLTPAAFAPWLLLAASGSIASACQAQDPARVVTLFHAASLARVLYEFEQEIERDQPGLDLRLEPSGSTVAARKVSELHRPADLVLVADWRVIEDLLVPGQADWCLQWAVTEIVLAHGEHSPYTEQIDASNWPELLTRDSVRLGRADENTAPIGFQTLMAWELSERFYPPQAAGPGLAARLKARCRPEHVVADIGELVALLQARAIDYAFVFRSIAEEHRLKVTRLPAAIHLGDPRLAADYARVQVPVRLVSSRPPVPLAGAPIVYGLTIPANAPNPAGAALVLAELLGPRGQRLLRRSGHQPIPPRVCAPSDRLPPALARLVAGQAAR